MKFMYVTTNLYEEKLRVKESEIEEQKTKELEILKAERCQSIIKLQRSCRYWKKK